MKIQVSMNARHWIVAGAGVGLLALGYGVGAIGVAQSAGTGLITIDLRTPVDLKPLDKRALKEGSAVPMAGTKMFYTSADNRVHVGIFEMGPGIFKLEATTDEFVQVAEGETVIRDSSGRSWTYKAGDSFLIPRGFVGEAEITKQFRKVFVSVLPAETQR